MKPALVLLILAACVSRALSPHRLGAAWGEAWPSVEGFS